MDITNRLKRLEEKAKQQFDPDRLVGVDFLPCDGLPEIHPNMPAGERAMIETLAAMDATVPPVPSTDPSVNLGDWGA